MTKTIYVVFCGGDGYDEEIKVFGTMADARAFVLTEAAKHWGDASLKYHNTPIPKLIDLCCAALVNHNYLYNLSDELENGIDNLCAGNCDLESSWWKIVKKEIDENGNEAPLKKYEVHYSLYFSNSRTVEARSKDEAEDIVKKMLDAGEIGNPAEMSLGERKVWVD